MLFLYYYFYFFYFFYFLLQSSESSSLQGKSEEELDKVNSTTSSLPISYTLPVILPTMPLSSSSSTPNTLQLNSNDYQNYQYYNNNHHQAQSSSNSYHVTGGQPPLNLQQSQQQSSTASSPSSAPTFSNSSSHLISSKSLNGSMIGGNGTNLLPALYPYNEYNSKQLQPKSIAAINNGNAYNNISSNGNGAKEANINQAMHNLNSLKINLQTATSCQQQLSTPPLPPPVSSRPEKTKSIV
jgi:hypothetical protein